MHIDGLMLLDLTQCFTVLHNLMYEQTRPIHSDSICDWYFYPVYEASAESVFPPGGSSQHGHFAIPSVFPQTFMLLACACVRVQLLKAALPANIKLIYCSGLILFLTVAL